MHIGFITSEYPNPKTPSGGGIATSIRNMAQGLVNAGNDVTVFIYAADAFEIFTNEGITLVKIPKKRFSFLSGYFYRKYLQKFINKYAVEHHIDILEAPDWGGMTAFMSFKIPLVIRLHGTDTFFCHLDKREVKKKNYFLEKKALLHADKIIAVSDFIKQKTAHLFDINEKEISVVHNGINLDKFRPLEQEKTEQKVILYFGTLIRKKGAFQLVEIMNALVEKDEEVKLILAGRNSGDILTGNPSTWELMQEKLTTKSKSKVEYLGIVAYDDLREVIQKASVCLFPSLAESFGMVAIEAMALGKVVITSHYDWFQEIIDENIDGFFIDPFDIEKSVQTIRNVVSLDNVSAVSEKAIKKVREKFDINILVKNNIREYRLLLNDK